MEDFARDLKTRFNHLSKLDNPRFLDELIDLLAWAHHWFLWIHPFADYNGRMSRLLINMILLNLELPPIEMKVETRAGRRKYVQALGKADKGNPGPLKQLIQFALEEVVRNWGMRVDSELR